MEVGGKKTLTHTLPPTALCYYECILRKGTSLLAPSHKNRPQKHTPTHAIIFTHTHTHTSTTKVLSLKWTSIRGRERCCHWGQKIAGGRYLDNISEAKTVKCGCGLVPGLLRARPAACTGCVATRHGGLRERK